MTFAEIRARVIFQMNADSEDTADYQPALDGYINDGYARMLYALTKCRIRTAVHPALTADTDVPKTPEWTHDAIADYATYLCYRNGNPQKQSRGNAFYNRFREAMSEATALSGGVTVADDGTITVTDTPPQFFNVYP